MGHGVTDRAEEQADHPAVSSGPEGGHGHVGFFGGAGQDVDGSAGRSPQPDFDVVDVGDRLEGVVEDVLGHLFNVACHGRDVAGSAVGSAVGHARLLPHVHGFDRRSPGLGFADRPGQGGGRVGGPVDADQDFLSAVVGLVHDALLVSLALTPVSGPDPAVR